MYVSGRYNIPIKKANYLTSFGAAVTLLLFLVIIPAIDFFLTKKLQLQPIKKDLLLSRASILLGIAGFLSLAFAPGLWMIIVAIIFFCAFGAVNPYARSLLTSLVRKDMVSTLYTTMAMLGTVSGLIGSPVFAALLGAGAKAGGIWSGVMYIIAALACFIGWFVVQFVRIPNDRKEDALDSEEEEGLLLSEDSIS